MSDPAYFRLLHQYLEHLQEHVRYLEGVVANSNIIHDRMPWRVQLPPLPPYGPDNVASADPPPGPRAVVGATSSPLGGPKCGQCGGPMIKRHMLTSWHWQCVRCGADATRVHGPEPTYYDDERPCSCDEALELRKRLERIRSLLCNLACEKHEAELDRICAIAAGATD